MTNPTGNRIAPMIGYPVCWFTITANTAASARMAPAMNARMIVSRVDMKIFDSPASTILVTNSAGARYDIDGSWKNADRSISRNGLPDELDLRPQLLRVARRREHALLVVAVLEQQRRTLPFRGERKVPLVAIVGG